MSVRQRRQLNRVVDAVSRLMPELSPRIIEPAADKQRELNIAEQTLLVRVGTHRMIALSPTESGQWTIQEMDSLTGDLVVLWGETGDLDDDQLGPIVLSAAIGSLEEQLALSGEIEVHEDVRPVLAKQLVILHQRLSMVTGGVVVAESTEANAEFEDAVG